MYLAHKYYAAENKRWPGDARLTSPASVEMAMKMLCNHFNVKYDFELLYRYGDDKTSWYDPGHVYDIMVLCWVYDEKHRQYIDMLTLIHEFAHYVEEYRRRKSRKPHIVRCHGKVHKEIVDEAARFINMWGWWGRLL
jgi:hypothetical protein